jgi:8-oxo-dGTP pyrophosphatase MutT (NUDIX family)
MDRADLLAGLDRYTGRHPEEIVMIDRVRDLVTGTEHCFQRDCFPGHITSSAWIISRESRAVLLTHHRKLERWLQLGGHTDGEENVLASALREAEEESGLTGFVALPRRGTPEIFDVDVHEIPAFGSEPAHAHHDIRFLLEVSDRQPIEHQRVESKEVRWFQAEGIEGFLAEESLIRMARKAARWLSRSPVGPA